MHTGTLIDDLQIGDLLAAVKKAEAPAEPPQTPGPISALLVQQLRHPERPRFHQRAGGSGVGRNHTRSARDPCAPQESGFARDDAIGRRFSL